MRDTSLADSGPGDNPFVTGFQDPGEIVIAENRGRQTLAPASDGGVSQWRAPAQERGKA
jgi:hypothetical protein